MDEVGVARVRVLHRLHTCTCMCYVLHVMREHKSFPPSPSILLVPLCPRRSVFYDLVVVSSTSGTFMLRECSTFNGKEML